MANNDWEPDDLLNFNYDGPVPVKAGETRSTDFDILDELEGMEAPPKATKAAKPVKPSAAPAPAPAEPKKRGLDASFDSYDELKRYEKLRQQSSRERQSSREQQGGRVQQSGRQQQSDVRSQGFAAREKDAPVHGRHEKRAMEIAPPMSGSSRHAASRASEPAEEKAGSADRAKVSASASAKASDRDSDDAIFFEYDRTHEKPRAAAVELPEEKRLHSADIDAIKQASQEAYDRYRSNYTKNKKKKLGRQPVGRFHKILTIIYVAALAAFAVSMTVMNVLPTPMLIAMYVVLALLSLLIFFQIRKGSIKKWAKRLATVLAVLLIIVYGVGTAYAMGTLSFLHTTSVSNEDSVADITRDPFNVVITGMDVSGTIDEKGRSDVNMVLTVNPTTAQILMTSIPRDYEVYMPNYDNAMDKLTHTGFYSVETTVLAEEQLLDIEANYYVKVNFTTVEKFIDAIGGVDVYSEYEFTPVKMKDWTVQQGMNHMNGKQALAFARERKAFADGDNQRIKNQQAVFEAMFKKATSSRTMIFSYNKILSNLEPYFEMSFSSGEIRQLAKMQLAFFPDWQIYKNTITGGDDSLYTYTAGYAYVMTQDPVSIENAKTLINAVFEGRALAKDENGMAYVADDGGDAAEGESEE